MQSETAIGSAQVIVSDLRAVFAISVADVRLGWRTGFAVQAVDYGLQLDNSNTVHRLPLYLRHRGAS
jgi:hypothetical protein